MSYKHLSILLLLQVFLFIQCSTAETPNSKKNKSIKVRNSFMDTPKSSSNPEATSNKKSDGPINNENKTTANNKSEATVKTKESLKQENFKQIQFGFNIGYLVDLQYADLGKKVLSQLKQDGISNLRIYEPFTKAIVKKPALAANLLTPLTNAGFKILLCLSNYPEVSSIQYDQSAFNAEQNQMRSSTNRMAPQNLDAYQSYLSNFLDDLQNKNILQNVSFEIGNEPDAKKYFWGKPGDFIRVARAVKQTLAKYNKPVYCCGFTSEFAKQISSKGADYYNFLNDNNFFNNVNLSFHFYQDAFDIGNVHLPRLSNAIISEFNMFSYQKNATADKTAATNSSAFGSLLIKGLLFAYKNNIKAIYFFRAYDIPGKEGTTGFFDQNGNAKPSYQYFKNIFDVVKNEYAAKENNNSIIITGDNETILYALRNNVPVPNKTIVSSSNSSNARTLSKDDWVIYKN